MSSGDSIGISNGTKGKQGSIDQMNLENVASKNEDSINRIGYLINVLSKSSPIEIPSHATIKEEQKRGYYQVKYIWSDEKYTYVCRWHTRTPNSPDNQGNSWVIQRDKRGKGYGKDARPAEHEILIGKNKWVSFREWRNAIYAKNKGIATEQQKEMLENGHWNEER